MNAHVVFIVNKLQKEESCMLVQSFNPFDNLLLSSIVAAIQLSYSYYVLQFLK